MADDQGQEPIKDGQEPQPEATEAGQDAGWEGDFNPERAKATIEKLRGFEKESKELKKRLREIEQQEQDKAKAAKAAEAKRLEEQQEWRELAEKRQAALVELEPYKEMAERYKGALGAVLEAQRKGLPEHITTLLDKLDPVDQLAWIADNQEAIRKPTVPQTNAGAPAAKAKEDPSARLDELRQRFRF